MNIISNQCSSVKISVAVLMILCAQSFGWTKKHWSSFHTSPNKSKNFRKKSIKFCSIYTNGMELFMLSVGCEESFVCNEPVLCEALRLVLMSGQMRCHREGGFGKLSPITESTLKETAHGKHYVFTELNPELTCLDSFTTRKKEWRVWQTKRGVCL